MSVLLTVISWMLLGSLTSYLAQQRGRDPIIWFFIGIFLGLFGLALLFILSALSDRKKGVSEVQPRKEEGVIEVIGEQVKPKIECTSLAWYYIDRQRQQQGPMPFVVFQKEWQDQKIDPSTYVWTEGLERWIQVESFPELLQALTN